MTISINSYTTAVRRLQPFVKQNPSTSLPEFKMAPILTYAKSQEVENKALNLFDRIIDHLKDYKVEQDIAFTENESVHLPDIHGDIVHLLFTLYRHNLIDLDLNLNRTHKYQILGDVYDRGNDADVVDYWLNRQIENGVTIYRLIGDHEINFFTNEKDLIAPCNDMLNDATKRDYQLTEELLLGMQEGKLLGAYLEYDSNTGVPIVYAHSFFTNKDFEHVEIETTNPAAFVTELNKRVIKAAQISLKQLQQSKRIKSETINDEEYKHTIIDGLAVGKPFTDEKLLDITKGIDLKRSSYMMRRPKITDQQRLDEKLPAGILQITGHTPTRSSAFINDIDIPLIIQDALGTSSVLFSDIAFGYSSLSLYDEENFRRPSVIINRNNAKLV